MNTTLANNMFAFAKKHPLIALIIGAFAAAIIWGIITERDDINPLTTESTSTTGPSLSFADLFDDVSFDECIPLFEAEFNAQQTSDTAPRDPERMPFGCHEIIRECSDFRELQSELDELNKAIKQKYGLPEDAVDIYGEFIKNNDPFFVMGLKKNGKFESDFRELITSYKYLRVALNDKDQTRVDELTELQKRPLGNVTNYCKQVP